MYYGPWNRNRIVVVGTAVLALIALAVWFFDSTIYNSLFEYLNEHGGYALLIFGIVTLFTWLHYLSYSVKDQKNLLLATVATILFFAVLALPMMIPLAEVVPEVLP